MLLISSCARWRAEGRGRRTASESVGASGGSIAFCGCCPSSASPSISTCVGVTPYISYLPTTTPPTTLTLLLLLSAQASWCSLIAKRTFTLRYGLAFPYAGMTTTSPNKYIAFLNSLATSAYRAVMIATCVFVSFALGHVPVGGGVFETAFFCWVDA
jgi:hypothetical protein